MVIKRYKKIGVILAVFFAIAVLVLLTYGKNFAVFNPAGSIAKQQLNIFLFAASLSLIVIIPVFTLTAYIVHKYRADKNAEHKPDWDNNHVLEFIWWGIPIILIIILSIVTWKTSHSLEPSRALVSDKKPVNVQVIAAEWKWVFIYPEENIATVNYLKVPVNTPINFEITSDAAMNSFWIPQLGSQIYAMTGMATKLHLIGEKNGTYTGVSSNISGEGFAGMKFQTYVVSDADYKSWLNETRSKDKLLDQKEYNHLSAPSKNVPPMFYSSVQPGLFTAIIDKYMKIPESSSDTMHSDDNAKGDYNMPMHMEGMSH